LGAGDADDMEVDRGRFPKVWSSSAKRMTAAPRRWYRARWAPAAERTAPQPSTTAPQW